MSEDIQKRRRQTLTRPKALLRRVGGFQNMWSGGAGCSLSTSTLLPLGARGHGALCMSRRLLEVQIPQVTEAHFPQLDRNANTVKMTAWIGASHLAEQDDPKWHQWG